MNAHQRRKVRRQEERQRESLIDEFLEVIRRRGYPSKRFAQAVLTKRVLLGHMIVRDATGKVITQGNLYATNQERK